MIDSYVARGWSIIPIVPGTKVPPAGFPLADYLSGRKRMDPASFPPDHDVAIVTGAPSGIVVVDIDPRNGGSLEDTLAHFQEFSDETLTVTTRSGGQHIYCLYAPLRSGKSALPGVDLKGDGGYVLAPPSSGYVAKDGGLARLPVSLTKPAPSTEQRDPWVADTLASPESVLPGTQEDTLTRLCWYAAGHWEQDVAQVILQDWASRLPLSKDYDPWTEQHVTDRLDRAYAKREDTPTWNVEVDISTLLDKARAQTPAALEAASDPEIDWLCVDFLAPGAFHEVLGVMKEGKTTWLLGLIKASRSGDTFLGRPTRPIRALYVTEQMGVSLKASLRRAGLQDADTDFYILTIADVMGSPWKDVAPEIVKVATTLGCNLLVFDTLSRIAQIEEEDAAASVAMLNPLIAAKAAGIAVVFLRHSRKSGGEVNVAGRGSGAFTGEMDVAIQITAPQGVTSDYRYLRWVSRLTEADDLHLEYADGTYEIGEDPAANPSKMQRKYALILDALSTSHPIPLTVTELVAASGKPRQTVARWLKKLEDEGVITKLPYEPGQVADKYGMAPPREVEV